MATNVIAPIIFVEHATRLRARKLEQIAANLNIDRRLRVAPKPEPAAASTQRRDLSSVLRQFRGRSR